MQINSMRNFTNKLLFGKSTDPFFKTISQEYHFVNKSLIRKVSTELMGCYNSTPASHQSAFKECSDWLVLWMREDVMSFACEYKTNCRTESNATEGKVFVTILSLFIIHITKP